MEDINRVDQYLAPKLLEMSDSMADRVARLVINLGNLSETIGRMCRPGYDVLDEEMRRAFLLDVEKKINEIEY